MRRTPTSRRPVLTSTLAATCLAGLALGLTGASSPGAPAGAAASRPDMGMRVFAADKWGDSTADSTAKDAYGKNAAEKDPGSLFTIEKAIGARALWGRKDAQGRPDTGLGVGVAVLDSGVDPVPGLDAANKITYGPDLSVEGNGELSNRDTYGHGTFMAGIIAGRGTSNASTGLPSAPAQVQLGVAPDAKLVALKLATGDGSVDVSQVIAALDWVTEHPVLPDGTRIRVVNLSYGTTSDQAYTADPLAAAAENAWRHGIVVVTSAGNDGADDGHLTDPAIDPYVIAVGATDSKERTDGWQGDHAVAASFSSVGTAARHADLSAPGTSVVSLRDPNSSVDTQHSEGRIAGDYSGRLFRGSGTSQAAAVTSGAVADLLQAFPALTPDQVKYVLVQSAVTVKNADPNVVGAGTLNLTGAYDLAAKLLGKDGAPLRAAAVQQFATSTGQGSIDAARGDTVLLDADGNPIQGEVDAQGNPWDPQTWWTASSNLTAWSGGQYLGITWSGDGWDSSGGGTSSARWSSARWSSGRWSSVDWSSARWSSARWSSARWSSARWSSARWSGNNW